MEQNTSLNGANESAQTLGQYLSQARLAAGMSVNDLAQRTNRPASYVEALEADNFAPFSSPIVVRAIVSQYVKAVGADPVQAGTLLPNQFKPTSGLASVGIKEGQKPIKQTDSMARSGLPKLGLVLLSLLVLALLAYWVFGARLFKGRDEAQKLTPPNQVQVNNPPTQAAAPTATPAPPVVADAAAQSGTAPAATPVADATATTTTPAATDGLNLKFHGPVWVEIKDAKGMVLLTGLQQPDTEKSITGEAPLSVKVGDGTKVEMSWKGQPYDLAPLLQGGRTVVRIKDLQ